MPYPRINYGLLCCLIALIISACTDTKINQPIVNELQAIPNKIDISAPRFHNKPFTIRARYSNNKTVNISKRVTWVSENSQLLTINEQGEISLNQPCTQTPCLVSVIATDPESGKSVRLSVNINIKPKSLKKTSSARQVTDEPVIDQVIDENLHAENVDEQSPEAIVDSSSELNSTHLPISFAINSTSQEKPVNEHSRIKAKSLVYVHRLGFENSNIKLQSGEQYVVPVWGMTNNGQQINKINNRISCFSVEGDDEVVDILPGCRFVARHAGELKIKARLNEAQPDQAESAIFTIQVSPRAMGNFVNQSQYAIQLAAENTRLWLQLSELLTGEHYWFNLSGDLPAGARLSVLNIDKANRNTCMNTLTGEFNSVSCYILATGDELAIVIDNQTKKAFSGSLTMKVADSEILNKQRDLSAAKAKPISLGNIESSFVFANETGLGSKHYYQYQPNVETPAEIQVKLYDYTADILLSVFWFDGHCSAKMLKRQSGEIRCVLPKHVQSNVQIVVDGNNGGFGLANGPAAEQGGSDYRLVVDALTN